mmetsp:Transcript_17743/g.36347  ORF Transcript_17743/g.36347 Transcript_17743/m.36347 type:complete len:208 (+) Transcript_17743:161-784(+)
MVAPLGPITSPANFFSTRNVQEGRSGGFAALAAAALAAAAAAVAALAAALAALASAAAAAAFASPRSFKSCCRSRHAIAASLAEAEDTTRVMVATKPLPPPPLPFVACGPRLPGTILREAFRRVVLASSFANAPSSFKSSAAILSSTQTNSSKTNDAAAAAAAAEGGCRATTRALTWDAGATMAAAVAFLFASDTGFCLRCCCCCCC